VSKKAYLKKVALELFGNTASEDNFFNPTSKVAVAEPEQAPSLAGVATLTVSQPPIAPVAPQVAPQVVPVKRELTQSEIIEARIQRFRQLQNLSEKNTFIPIPVKDITPPDFLQEISRLKKSEASLESISNFLKGFFPDTGDENLDYRRAVLTQICLRVRPVRGIRRTYLLSYTDDLGHIVVDPYGFATRTSNNLTFRGNIYSFPKHITLSLEGEKLYAINEKTEEKVVILDPSQELDLSKVDHYGADSYTNATGGKRVINGVEREFWGYPMLRIRGERKYSLRIHTIIAALYVGLYPALVATGSSRLCDIHHINPFSLSFDNSPSNIAVLWKKEHEALHGGKGWLYRERRKEAR